ncbi:MAG: TonB-dependent receptor [Kangiellaceae bacterium]|nr:TonB-dependent receptor [Kangiellaceae bacterium]
MKVANRTIEKTFHSTGIIQKNRFHKLMYVAPFILFVSLPTAAQEARDDEISRKKGEEIVIVGSQIRGAAVQDALAVTIITADDIEALGIDSGDELLDMLPESGNNFMNEAENISGGVNAARGDVGAFNLRSLGTGNTLVLLNGRRVVNSATFQTEEVGGSFVPVNSPNSSSIPVTGLQRLEVLRDGASAIYGADAVAGVVNHVMKDNFEGFNIRAKYSDYESLSRKDKTFNLEWGKDFNNGRSNLSAFFNYYDRGRVNSTEDPRWSESDFRSRLPLGSLWSDSTVFRNDSANSLYGQFDLVSSASGAGLRDLLTDRSGEFETYPVGDPRCQYEIGYGTCGAIDGQGTYRHNLNENRDINSKLERSNLYVSFVHDFGNGLESFNELSFYNSKTNLLRHASASFSSVKLRVAADNYWNPLGPCGSANRLPDSVIGTDVPCTGLELILDNYRFAELPRVVDNDGQTYRLLAGLRGDIGDWDWESAITTSKSTKDEVTHNRVSNTLMQAALNDTTASAYNPFSGGVNSNIEQAIIDVYRNSESELSTFDLKFSNNGIFDMPAGPVGFLAGIELRRESFRDDRDDRLDGTIIFTDWEGDTYPYISDVLNSSPTLDNIGSRNVSSLFTEIQLPLLEDLDVQAAIRYEDSTDVQSTTVGKVAFGWRPFNEILFRGSWSEAFRAPNLVTLNEDIIARNNTRTDWACVYAAGNGGDPNQDTLDCTNNIQRIAQGSDELKPEESTNTSLGFVFSPFDNLTVSLDYWTIEKTDTIGLFGEENHSILDLILRLQNGPTGCDSASFNSAVVRNDPTDDEIAIYQAAGVCPAGELTQVFDRYANLDTRTVEGHDISIYYTLDSSFGKFDFKYNAAMLDELFQEAGGESDILLEAQAQGLLPSSIPIAGFDDLIGKDGNQEKRQSAKLHWSYENYGASVTANRIGEFYQDSLTLESGQRYVIPAMTTVNMSFTYKLENSRIRFGVNNIADRRAPLADRYFGFFSDSHRDLGKSYYLDFKYYISK